MGGYFPTTPSTGGVGGVATNTASVGATSAPRQVGGSTGRRPRKWQTRPRPGRQTAGVQVNALQPTAGTQGNWF